MNPRNWRSKQHMAGGKVNLKWRHWTDYLGEQVEHHSTEELLRSHAWAPGLVHLRHRRAILIPSYWGCPMETFSSACATWLSSFPQATHLEVAEKIQGQTQEIRSVAEARCCPTTSAACTCMPQPRLECKHMPKGCEVGRKRHPIQSLPLRRLYSNQLHFIQVRCFTRGFLKQRPWLNQSGCTHTIDLDQYIIKSSKFNLGSVNLRVIMWKKYKYIKVYSITKSCHGGLKF